MLTSTDNMQGLKVWDLYSEQVSPPIFTCDGCNSAWSPDGSQLAVGTSSGQYILYKTADWSKTAAETMESASRTDVAWNSCTGQLVSWGDDSLIRCWDSRPRARCLLTLRGHIGRVNSVTFEPSGGRLASSGADGTVKIWALPPRSQPVRLQNVSRNQQHLSWDKESETICSFDVTEGVLTRWNVATGKRLGQIRVTPGESGQISPAGDIIGVPLPRKTSNRHGLTFTTLGPVNYSRPYPRPWQLKGFFRFPRTASRAALTNDHTLEIVGLQKDSFTLAAPETIRDIKSGIMVS